MIKDDYAIILVDYQIAYTYNNNLKKNFPFLESNFRRFIYLMRYSIEPEHIIHIRTNYNSVFANNFRRYNNNKPIPADVDAVDWAYAMTGEKIIVKTSFDGFLNTDLHKYLLYYNIKRVIICGVLTSVCVLFTAQTAFALGYDVYLYEPCCADRSKQTHDDIIRIYNQYLFKKILRN